VVSGEKLGSRKGSGRFLSRVVRGDSFHGNGWQLAVNKDRNGAFHMIMKEKKRKKRGHFDKKKKGGRNDRTPIYRRGRRQVRVLPGK